MPRPRLLPFLLPLFVLIFAASAFAAEFNQQDKDAETNGNMPIAIAKLLQTTPEALVKEAQPMTTADITKKIYPSLGKVVQIRGKVYKVEELPPMKKLPGTWTEVLLMTKNPNAPLGRTTVDFMYQGDSSNINAKDVIICTGYLIGIHSGTNAYGGAVHSIGLIGNHFTKVAK